MWAIAPQGVTEQIILVLQTLHLMCAYGIQLAYGTE